MSKLALQLIEENKRTQDPFLDLGNCGLKNELPEELFECVWLKELNLGQHYKKNNEWTRTKNDSKYYFQDLSSPDNNIINGENLVALKNLSRLHTLYLIFCRIDDYSFLSDINQLKCLFIDNINVTNIDFLKKLTQLNTLLISFTKNIESEDKSKVEININIIENLTNLHNLSIWGVTIQNLEFLNELPELQVLDFQNCEIWDSSFLGKLKYLHELHLRNIKISDSSFIEKLTGLQTLNLSSTKISDFSFIEKMTSLQKLNLSSNQISDIRFLEKLTSLQILNLSSNQISDIRFLEKLTSLQILNLSANQISDISALEKLMSLQILNLSNNQISDIHFIHNLNRLETLILSYNQISDISALEKLTNLDSLGLRSNQISDFRFIEKLTRLKALNISANKILNIDFLRKLTNLIELDISSNDISDIEPILHLLKKGLDLVLENEFYDQSGNKIFLHNNPISNPPTEILEQGHQSVLNYFEKLDIEGIDYLYEAKMTLVGEGGSGKTSLQYRIVNKNAELPKAESRTRGIEISEWHFKDKEDIKYKVNVWDFGGQDIYYPVHRFFLTENSVYLLMSSTRTLTHNFEYWIPTIYQFGNKSPIILVQNCHDGNRSHWNDLGVFYSNSDLNILKPHYEINLPNDNEGLKDLENVIEQQIIKLPHIGKTVPKSWVKVRAALAKRKETDACISYEKFVSICQEVDFENFKKPSDIILLGRFFADLGIILWYHDKDYLKDWVILQPRWIMNAVYRIIDDIEIQRSGIIHKIDFTRLWVHDGYEEKSELLKKMLQVFKIAFPKKHPKDDFILPARLNSLPTDKRWTNIDKTIRIEYTFDFMPRGIVNQVSAELSRRIKSDNDIWNNAVNFEFNKSQAQVEEDYFKRVVSIKASGNEARSLVVLIMESIDNTLQGYKGVKPSIKVPCYCEYCQKNEIPTFFDYSKLIEWSLIKPTVVCNESSTEMTIYSLLYNVGFDLEKKNLSNNTYFQENESQKQLITDNNKLHINFRPEISINPSFVNTQNVNPINQSESKKEESKEDKVAEEKSVKRWKRASVLWCLIVSIISTVIIFIYQAEPEILLSKNNWCNFKESDYNLIAKFILSGIWGSFIYKMLYDRLSDPSKEKSFRDLWKSKNK